MSSNPTRAPCCARSGRAAAELDVKRCIFLLAALCAATLCATRAYAAPGDATRLEYARSDHAVGCPDRDALKSAVVKRLGYDPFFPAARQTIVVEITDLDGGLSAQMRLVDDQGIIRGSRELRDKVENCGELVASLALAISIALDPSAALRDEPAVDAVAQGAPTPKKEAAEAQAEAPTEPPTPTEAAPPPAKRSNRARTATPDAGAKRGPTPFALRVSGFGAFDAAPSLAVGARLGGSVRSEWFRVVVELEDQLSASRSAPLGGKVQTSLLDASVAPCAAWRSFAGCALFEMGSLRAEGSGIDSPLVQRSLYMAAGVRFEIAPELAQNLRLLVSVETLKTLTPVTLRLLSADVWKTPFLAVAGGLGLELQIP
jgi:hypothetical protein